MTNQHPITPPPELVQCFLRSNPVTPTGMTYEQFIATRFSQWGADQELEACCEVMRVNGDYVSDGVLRAIRRPKLLSDKEQALAEVAGAVAGGNITPERGAIIRKALEAL